MKLSPLCNLGDETPFFLNPYVYMLIYVSFAQNNFLIHFILQCMRHFYEAYQNMAICTRDTLISQNPTGS